MWFCLPARKTGKASTGVSRKKRKRIGKQQLIPQSILLVTKQPFHSFFQVETTLTHLHSSSRGNPRSCVVPSSAQSPESSGDSPLHQLPHLFPKIRTKKRNELSSQIMVMWDRTATHPSTLVWKTPWTEEPCRLQSMVLQRVGHD